MSEQSKDICKFTREEIARLTEVAVDDKDIHVSDIPDLDLYIDQILTLVATRTADSSHRFSENLLTKTMINNYSKEGLLMPVKGKKYTKEHILQMLLIYSLKNTLSIGEIHRVLEGSRGEGVQGEELSASYERFLEIKKWARESAMESARELMTEGGLESEKGDDFFVALLGLLSCSAYMKNIALELLEARYPLPPEKERDKEKDKEKDKEAKVKEKEKHKAEKKEKTSKRSENASETSDGGEEK